MAEAAESDQWAHIRGVTVTTSAALSGLLAGFVAAFVAAGPDDEVGLIVLAGAILVQFPVLRLAGVAVEDFGVKDYLFIAFMTFSLWFVSWGILLTSRTPPAV